MKPSSFRKYALFDLLFTKVLSIILLKVCFKKTGEVDQRMIREETLEPSFAIK